jgi:hypothetical protein
MITLETFQQFDELLKTKKLESKEATNGKV